MDAPLRYQWHMADDMIAVARAPARLRNIFTLLLSLLVAAASVAPSHAQQRAVSLVRDAEIEALVRDYTTPLLGAAGLSRSGIEVVLVNDPSFNAFVLGRRIFVNTGALLQSETPNEIIGVLAHEIGHLAGGHQQRLREQMSRAQTMAVAAAILGVGAGIAGSAAGMQGAAGAGVGLAIGGSDMARRGLLGYMRTEETTADRSAFTYLEATGQSTRGMLRTFERMASSLSLSGARVDPYQLSHPMPRERIANLQTLAQGSRHYDRADPPALQQRHDMMRAKIAAYTRGQAETARLFQNQRGSVAERYADAITSFLYGNPRAALPKIDALIANQPSYPYFHEIRGEMLMKANRPAEAAQAFANAYRLDPNQAGLLQIGHGQALLATGNPDSIRRAVSELQQGLARAREYGAGYRYLAQAYGQLGEVAKAELATADGHFYSGNYRDAKIFAARAQQKMPRGTPDWVRAQDIINFRQPGR